MNKNKNLGFTLAEVLIVIGIIGVVAALTLPNLNHATGDKERITKVKKIYGALTEAYDRAQAIYGSDFSTWFSDNETTYAQRSEKFGKRITEFMKISKECSLDVDEGCFTAGNSHYLGSSNAPNYNSDNAKYKVITADGMSLAISEYHAFVNNVYQSSITIIVDIDGPNKGSYTFGKDLFQFNINSDKPEMISVPTGGPGGPEYNFVALGVTSSRWILENDNADYLKADGQGNCNDSDVVLNWTTNTSCH